MFDKIIAHTSFIGETGYANHSRNFFTALNKIIPVKVRNFAAGGTWTGLNNGKPHEDEWYLTDEHRRMLYKQTCTDNGKRTDHYIYGGSEEDEKGNVLNIVLNEVNHYYFYDNYNGPKIAYNVWETTLYPEDFFDRLLEFDQLWVPTKWQRDCVIKQGYVGDNVKIVPEAVDANIFCPEEILKIDSLDDYKDDRFKFLLFGRWDYRKSIEEIMSCFLNTFSKDEPVDLIASVDNPFSIDGIKTTEERLKHYGFEDDRIKIKHFPSREDYVKYLKSGNVFLSCARSEGWNLPLIESIACGTPSIYSNWGAQLEFAEGKGLPVDIIGEKLASNGEGQGYIGDAPGNFCEPDFNNLSTVMRDAYKNYKDHKRKALEDSEIIIKEFTWEHMAIKSHNNVKDFYKNMMGKTLNMELYQDQFINGNVIVKGSRSCNDRYDSLKKVFSNYKRSFTILDIGANFGYYSIRASSEYDAISVMIEGRKEECDKLVEIAKSNYCKEKLIVINKKLTIYDLEEMVKCEHFDVVFALNVLHHFDKKDIHKACDLVSQLGDNLIIETPPIDDEGACGKENLEYIVNYFKNKDKILLGSFDRHTDDKKSDIFWLKTNKDKLTSTYFEYDTLMTNGTVPKDLVHLLKKPFNLVLSNFEEKKIINNKKQKQFKWIDGINLKTFISLNGVYPNHNFLINSIQNRNIETDYKWDNTNRDLVMHNFIMNGHKLNLIDFDDEGIEGKNQKTDDSQISFLIESLTSNPEKAENEISRNPHEIVDKYMSGIKTDSKNMNRNKINAYIYILEKLLSKNKEINIIETGCSANIMSGGGTSIFSDFIANVSKGKIVTIDISQSQIDLCKELTKENKDYIDYRCGDSVSVLGGMTDSELNNIDLFYFDSYELDLKNPQSCMEHHLRELKTVFDNISDEAIIAVDDNYIGGNWWMDWHTTTDNWNTSSTERLDMTEDVGKGILIRDFLLNNGWKMSTPVETMVNCVFIFEKDKEYKPIVKKDDNEVYKSVKPYNKSYTSDSYNSFSHRQISILVVHRGDLTGLLDTVETVFNLSKYKDKVEMLIRLDDDEEASYNSLVNNKFINSYNIKIYSGDRYGFINMHKYWNEIAGLAVGDILIPWGDGLQMLDYGWDEDLYQHVGSISVFHNITYKMENGKLVPWPWANLSPGLTRGLYDIMGMIGPSPLIDGYLDHVGGRVGIKVRTNARVLLSGDNIPNDGEQVACDHGSSPPIKKQMAEDVDRVIRYLEEKNISRKLVPDVYFNLEHDLFVELTGGDISKKYFVEYINESDNSNIFGREIKTYTWVRNKVPSDISLLLRVSSVEDGIFFEKRINTHPKAFICFDSRSLGDNLAWMPYIEEYMKKNDRGVVACTFWNKLFELEYPEIDFVEPGSVVNNISGQYNIGWYEPWNPKKNPNNFRTIPLQQTCSDILGLDYKEVKPRITIPNKPRNIEGKYVCIGVHATAQVKYWNNPNGWREVADYLNSKGYKVICISKEGMEYMGNKVPDNIIDKTGDYSIEDRIVDLKYADAFIGISSGLSWLSWAVGTPTVLISGHTYPWFEPSEGVERVHNSEVCHSCGNDPDLVFDKGDWNWCPRNKNFECSKSITPEDVIQSINKILS
jgi:autotransporter strand-loop-strand O-heptosyltransferase